MAEHVVSCGCGRTMKPARAAGRGAYRCGCGARVSIASSPTTTRPCWWTGCRTASYTKAPINLCEEHLGAVAQHIASPDGYRALWGQATSKAAQRLQTEGSYVQPEPKPTQVYFLRRETLIKIGYSNTPARRAQQLNAELLATIPGGAEEERELHRRFAAHWVHGEWFHPTSELIASINVLRHEKGLRPISATPERDLRET